jgi:hypothetical protein
MSALRRQPKEAGHRVDGQREEPLTLVELRAEVHWIPGRGLVWRGGGFHMEERAVIRPGEFNRVRQYSSNAQRGGQG